MRGEHQSGSTDRGCRPPLDSTEFTVPPHAYFAVSAIFHSLGPAFAVLLFSRVEVLGVAWLRLAAAALIFGVWCRPWTLIARASQSQLTLLVAMGLVLGIMNSTFYLAISRVPLATVSSIECLGPVILAACGARSMRNATAVGAAASGALLLTGVRLSGTPIGFAFAFANAALFGLYVVLGHRIVREGLGRPVERLAAAMLIAMVVVTPIGLGAAVPALRDPWLIGAGIGVGLCSSVIPYVCDQLAMARLSRASFALMLFMLPAMATLIGAVVLRQFPTATELCGIVLVVAGLALHREARSLPTGAGGATRA